MAPNVDKLLRLLEVSALLTSTLDLDSLLRKILETAESLMAAEASNVMLLDRARDELVYEVVLGDAGSRIKSQKRLKIGVGIAGWVAKNGEPLLIEDAYSDPRFFREFDRLTGFTTKSILCIPLKVQNNLIGVAQIINKKNAPSFSVEDQVLFGQFCTIAAVAIDNALLHRQTLEQDRLKRDMQLAVEIQQAFLPESIPSIPNLRLEYRSLPCRQVAGDVIDMDVLPDGRLAVLVADVSGKGVPAALFGVKFSTEYEYEHAIQSNSCLLFKKLNSLVARQSTRGMFVTAVYAAIDPKNGKVELINAGHLLPVIVRPSGNLQRVETSSFPPLGVVEEQEFTSTVIQLKKGDRLLFMTDGVTEAKAPDGNRLGDRNVEEALSLNPSNAVASLVRRVKMFTQDEALVDDITIVSIAYSDYEERHFSSHPEELARIREFVEALAKSANLGEKAQGRVCLAVTEAVTNIIRHTYDGDFGQNIQIGIERCAVQKQLKIYIRDWGRRQDPASFTSRALDDIRPGGLGIHYMKQVMNIVEFDNSHVYGNEVFMMIQEPEKVKS